MKSEPLRPLLEVEEQGSASALISPVTISTIQSIPSPKAKQKHLVFMVDGEASSRLQENQSMVW